MATSVRHCGRYSLILAIPPDVRAAATGVGGAVVVDIVQERLGDHLHLIALDSGTASSEARLVHVSSWSTVKSADVPTK